MRNRSIAEDKIYEIREAGEKIIFKNFPAFMGGQDQDVPIIYGPGEDERDLRRAGKYIGKVKIDTADVDKIILMEDLADKDKTISPERMELEHRVSSNVFDIRHMTIVSKLNLYEMYVNEGLMEEDLVAMCDEECKFVNIDMGVITRLDDTYTYLELQEKCYNDSNEEVEVIIPYAVTCELSIGGKTFYTRYAFRDIELEGAPQFRLSLVDRTLYVIITETTKHDTDEFHMNLMRDIKATNVINQLEA